MAPFDGRLNGEPVTVEQLVGLVFTGASGPTGEKDWTATWTAEPNVSRQPFPDALKFRPPFAGSDAVWIAEIDARNDAKLIGVGMTERTVDEGYFFAPLYMVTAPVMLPSA